MTMEDGRFTPAEADEILAVLMNNARNQFGPDLNDDDEAVIRLFYIPVANLLEDIQQDISAVLDASQLDHAEGMELDLLTALIGVTRIPATASTGEVTFSRDSSASTDYTIPKGTEVQTEGVNPETYETSEKAILQSGNTSVSGVSIEALETGPDGNTGANTITVMPDPPTGIESVNNPNSTSGGKTKEADDDLRERAQDELSDGMRATARAVVNELEKVQDVKSVTLFINDSDSTDGNGLKSNHIEAVVEGGTDQAVGQTLFDTKAAAGGTQGGVHGTAVSLSADIGNGQTHPVEFTRPTTVQIYVDMEIETNSNYEGDTNVQDAIIQYLGGLLNSGVSIDGDLRVGENVVYTKIMAAIHSINGVEDVPTLTIGTSSSPTGTSNISISNTEVATGDATDGSITITVL